MTLRLEDLHLDLGGRTVVSGASLVVGDGELCAVVGPNGSGKSTLLRAVYRHLRPRVGQVRLDETDVWALRPAEAARHLAAVPQETRADFDITVWEMVEMGRTPHKHPFAFTSEADQAIVADALLRVDADGLAHRRYASLSGGERQRVLLARALAQCTGVLVLDEPTNHLDVRHQLELLKLVRELALTTLIAIHDLNLAAAHCDRLHVLESGRIVASGTPRSVLTPELLRSVFGVDADIVDHPRTGAPHLILSPMDSEVMTGKVEESRGLR